jgi:hypothetical protein
MSHFKGHFEGAKTFLTPYLGVKKVPQILKQRDINSYKIPHFTSVVLQDQSLSGEGDSDEGQTLGYSRYICTSCVMAGSLKVFLEGSGVLNR